MELLPAWQASVDRLATDLVAIGDAFTEWQPEVESAGKARSMGPRIVAIRNAALALEAPTSNFVESAKRYKALTIEIGKGISAATEMALISGNVEEITAGLELADTVITIQNALDDAMEKSRPLLQLARDMGRMSRDMRTPTKRIAEAITIIDDSRTLYSEWTETLKGLARELHEDDGIETDEESS